MSKLRRQLERAREKGILENEKSLAACGRKIRYDKAERVLIERIIKEENLLAESSWTYDPTTWSTLCLTAPEQEFPKLTALASRGCWFISIDTSEYRLRSDDGALLLSPQNGRTLRDIIVGYGLKVNFENLQKEMDKLNEQLLDLSECLFMIKNNAAELSNGDAEESENG